MGDAIKTMRPFNLFHLITEDVKVHFSSGWRYLMFENPGKRLSSLYSHFFFGCFMCREANRHELNKFRLFPFLLCNSRTKKRRFLIPKGSGEMSFSGRMLRPTFFTHQLSWKKNTKYDDIHFEINKCLIRFVGIRKIVFFTLHKLGRYTKKRLIISAWYPDGLSWKCSLCDQQMYV